MMLFCWRVFSKKDAAVRAQELRGYVSGTLLTYLTDHAADLLSNSHTSLMIPLILSHASGTPSWLFNCFCLSVSLPPAFSASLPFSLFPHFSLSASLSRTR